MEVLSTPECALKRSEALRLMSSSLDMLDETAAPAEIGAYLDHAIHRLENSLGLELTGEVAVSRLLKDLGPGVANDSGRERGAPSPW